MRTAVPAWRVTVLALPDWKPLTAPASRATSTLRAVLAVSGTTAPWLSMRIALSLSVKTMAPPLVRCAQPSGTFTEKPPLGGV
jgi:hypothetical protein